MSPEDVATRKTDKLHVSGETQGHATRPSHGLDFDLEPVVQLGNRHHSARRTRVARPEQYVWRDEGHWAGDARPARAVVPVPELHYGFKIEVEAVGRVA